MYHYRELTKREIDVMRLIAQGKRTEGTAKALGISVSTVRTHMERVRVKMNVPTSTRSIVVLLKEGILKLEEM